MSDLDLDSVVDVKPDLKKLSLEELRKLKETIGNEIFFNTSNKVPKLNSKTQSVKRKNKNRPSEISSKIEPSTIVVKKVKPKQKKEFVKQPIDPRFDSLYGEFDRRIFDKNYSFLQKIQSKEKKKLEKKLRSKNCPAEKKESAKFLLQRMENQEREKHKLTAKDNLQIEQKKKRLQDLKEGKKPQFLKKSESKILQLVGQYEELKSKGKLNKHIKKKRIRTLGNEKKNMFGNNTE
ncbi:ribosomal RNA processing protein 36 homolog isoform X2 [Daktulosphaira vitifoliae]|uniref:ribosomal RNA processing protein 36 homolog isoform X2 n=1 Tax=Daktulosphaira vitifoliae TaxID=58002 RepID=UPI0021A9E995|nr:ribosomal RNA processing protein 36 homolog isoform X2 [Daktulosphaira vitifoliae]XP_050536770.1 ribosomal RNA processing protein 36 homolog isoform X2 [Daktulosphaira vitifoliae]